MLPYFALYFNLRFSFAISFPASFLEERRSNLSEQDLLHLQGEVGSISIKTI